MTSWRERLARYLAALLLAVAASAVGVAHAQDEPPAFKPEEIDALVAPIALYPDSLLSQVLMASTYPLEIVQAARWVKANPNAKGDAAVKAVGPSAKASPGCSRHRDAVWRLMHQRSSS